MQIPVQHFGPTPLVRPGRGQSARWRLGRIELILEPVRGGWSLLCLDGEVARTWSLGLSDEGELWLDCRVPRLPVHLALRDPLVLVPRSRVRGYVTLPMIPTICWRDRDGSQQTIAELLPPMLTGEWDEHGDECVQRWSSPLFQRLPPPAEEPRLVLPLVVRNESPQMQSPETLPLRLDDREPRLCRGHVMGSPRRFRVHGDGAMAVEIRLRENRDAVGSVPTRQRTESLGSELDS